MVFVCVLAAMSFAEPRAALQTQTDMNEAARAEYTAAEAELNRVYQQILQARKSDVEFTLKFKAAQRAWFVFREAEAQALYPAADKRRAYGSIYPVCRAQVLTQLTVERTKQLHAWIDPPAEGDTCAGSRTP